MEEIKKRYFYTVTEEAVQNPDFFGFRAGRVEVYDRDSDSPYAMDEYRFMIPEELFQGFRETFDFKESDLPVMIKWDMFERPDINEKYYGESKDK